MNHEYVFRQWSIPRQYAYILLITSKSIERKVRHFRWKTNGYPLCLQQFHTCDFRIHFIYYFLVFFLLSTLFVSSWHFVWILSNWSNVIVHPNNQCGRRSYWPYAGSATSTQEKLLRFEFEKEKWRNPIHLIKLSILLFEENEWNARVSVCVESVCVCFVHSHHTAFLCPWMIVEQQQQRHEWNFDLWFI